ncbi:MAG: cupin domain-containing protein [Adhaeribacter sp.]
MKRLLRLGFTGVALLTWMMPVQAQVKAKTQEHAKQEHATMQHGQMEHTFYSPEGLEWKEGPASLPKGSKVALLEGDPAKEGPFTIRVKFPANYKIGPHWHPAIEHVTVLKGTLYMGMGKETDMGQARKLDTGGYAVMPAKMPHYAFTKDEALIQLHGIGPWGITYLNPADDPRTAPAP